MIALRIAYHNAPITKKPFSSSKRPCLLDGGDIVGDNGSMVTTGIWSRMPEVVDFVKRLGI